ncbi:hypothetical protein [Methanopyrus kandleri]|uniref:Uncharacterized protein n=2 Tax=Methanopyrus kandleri TaxID=2320 RepID=Q8TYV6_METKA|nr:hypothetical protein [Methanopyrus kandleri]AAM01402.1 Uncharacterized protein MK0185 [Methanopyrus kandleri AV19]HII70674.1 hypothetical protein [Methanopyrus kandleri]
MIRSLRTLKRAVVVNPLNPQSLRVLAVEVASDVVTAMAFSVRFSLLWIQCAPHGRDDAVEGAAGYGESLKGRYW